jgi:hypothetical protein
MLEQILLVCYNILSFAYTMSEYEGGTFRCTICAKEFISKAEADRHFSDTHSEEKTSVME